MELCSLVSRVTITGSRIPVVEVPDNDEEEEEEETEEEQGQDGDADGRGDPEVEPDTVTYISLMQ